MVLCDTSSDTRNKAPVLDGHAVHRNWLYFEKGSTSKMAEKGRNRTHQGRLTPPSGFEDRAPHQGAILSLNVTSLNIMTPAAAASQTNRLPRVTGNVPARYAG